MSGNIGYKKIVTDGLILYLDAANNNSYPGSGSSITNLSNGDDGLLVGTTYNSNNSGNISFNGTSDWLDATTATTSSNTSPYTFGGWVKKTTVSDEYAFVRGIDSFGSGWSLALTLRSDSNLGFGCVTSNGGNIQTSVIGTTTMTVGSWYYIIGTFNPGIGIEIFVNGNSEGVEVLSGDKVTLRDSSKKFVYGRITASLYGESIMGNYTVYDRVLTDAEILQNYNALKSRFI